MLHSTSCSSFLLLSAPHSIQSRQRRRCFRDFYCSILFLTQMIFFALERTVSRPPSSRMRVSRWWLRLFLLSDLRCSPSEESKSKANGGVLVSRLNAANRYRSRAERSHWGESSERQSATTASGATTTAHNCTLTSV